MSEQEMRAMFLLAGIPIRGVYKLANRYWPDCAEYAEYRSKSPWWLVAIEGGNVVIGWRKRVININWSDTPARGEVTKDDVTKSETMVHAWTYARAVEYLTTLARLFEKSKASAGVPSERSGE